MNKKILSLVLALIMILGTFSSVLADNFDFIHRTDSTKNRTFLEFLDDVADFDEIADNLEDYLFEYGGNLYSAEEVQDELDGGASSLLDAIAALTPEGPVDTTPTPPELDKIYRVNMYMENNVTTFEDSDGLVNTTLHVEFVDLLGNVVPVNGLQVNLTTTHGTLSNDHLTLMNGKAHTTFNTEFFPRRVLVDLDAQIIEGSVPVIYKEKISEMRNNLQVMLLPQGPDAQTDIPQLVGAESNQADRVTLIFDREVVLGDFDGASVNVYQTLVDPSEMGFYRELGNDLHTMDVILSKPLVLTDNQRVYVDLTLTNGTHNLTGEAEFILTDARKPEATAIHGFGNMKTIVVAFSEAMESASFSIDGGNPVITNANVAWGDFNSSTNIDNRHFATITVPGYLSAGMHTLQVSSPRDFASRTDTNNVGSTQTFEFEVLANIAKPDATVEVESPEQWRVNLNIPVTGSPAPTTLQVWNGTTWVAVSNGTNGMTTPREDNLIVETPAITLFNSDEFVVETDTDWTEVFDTDNSTVNYYNRQFRLFIPAGTFTNPANGLVNDDIFLPLPLQKDNVSPINTGIKSVTPSIGGFNLDYNEPVKGLLLEPATVGYTPSQLQQTSNNFPEIIVEYVGTDDTGTEVTIYGKALNYVKGKSQDDEFYVEADESLLALVDNECYGEDWTLIVRNVTDDIGNAAITLEHDFKVPATPYKEIDFEVDGAKVVIDAEVDGAIQSMNLPSNLTPAIVKSDYDIVQVCFSDFIKLGMNQESALTMNNYKVNNYTLNEEAHVLVNQASYKEIDTCRVQRDGFTGVYLLMLKSKGVVQRDSDGEPFNNTLEVNNNLRSKYSNNKLVKYYQEVMPYGECETPDEVSDDQQAANEVEDMFNNLPNADDVTLADEQAIEDAFDAWDALTPAQQALVSATARTEAWEALQALRALQDATAVQNVRDLIALISDPVTLADEQAIVDARTAYDNLDLDGQNEITPAQLNKLEDAEDTIAQIKIQAAIDDLDAVVLTVLNEDTVNPIIALPSGYNWSSSNSSYAQIGSSYVTITRPTTVSTIVTVKASITVETQTIEKDFPITIPLNPGNVTVDNTQPVVEL